MSILTEVKLILVKFQFDTSQQLTYLNSIIDEEINIDCSKTFIVDYSQFDFLRKNADIKKQIENDAYLAFNARVKDDFLEFCRCASLQLEVLTDYYYNYLYTDTTKVPPLKGRIKPFLEIICKNQVKKESKDIIYHIIDLRNIASHRDALNLPIDKQIEKKGRAVHLYVNNLKKEDQRKMQDNIRYTVESCHSNWDVRVKYINRNSDPAFAYINIYNTDLNLSEYEVKKQVSNKIYSIKNTFSNNKNFTVNFNKREKSSNRLMTFFTESESNYMKVSNIVFELFQYLDSYIADSNSS